MSHPISRKNESWIYSKYSLIFFTNSQVKQPMTSLAVDSGGLLGIQTRFNSIIILLLPLDPEKVDSDFRIFNLRGSALEFQDQRVSASLKFKGGQCEIPELCPEGAV